MYSQSPSRILEVMFSLSHKQSNKNSAELFTEMIFRARLDFYVSTQHNTENFLHQEHITIVSIFFLLTNPKSEVSICTKSPQTKDLAAGFLLIFD